MCLVEPKFWTFWSPWWLNYLLLIDCYDFVTSSVVSRLYSSLCDAIGVDNYPLLMITYDYGKLYLATVSWLYVHTVLEITLWFVIRLSDSFGKCKHSDVGLMRDAFHSRVWNNKCQGRSRLRPSQN